MNKHYVCPACIQTSDHLKGCDTMGCQMMGEQMKECVCTDGEHAEVIQAINGE